MSDDNDVWVVDDWVLVDVKCCSICVFVMVLMLMIIGGGFYFVGIVMIWLVFGWFLFVSGLLVLVVVIVFVIVVNLYWRVSGDVELFCYIFYFLFE